MIKFGNNALQWWRWASLGLQRSQQAEAQTSEAMHDIKNDDVEMHVWLRSGNNVDVEHLWSCSMLEHRHQKRCRERSIKTKVSGSALQSGVQRWERAFRLFFVFSRLFLFFHTLHDTEYCLLLWDNIWWRCLLIFVFSYVAICLIWHKEPKFIYKIIIIFWRLHTNIPDSVALKLI